MTPLRVGGRHADRYPGAEKAATECVINLIRAGTMTMSAVAPYFRKHGISGGTFNLLMILRTAGKPLAPYEIGERQLVTRGTVTGLLDTAEKHGLVRRVPHPDDRRMLLVELTEDGSRTLEDVCVELFPAQADMLRPLSAAERETLIGLLGKVQDALQSRS